ncbi:hypothetical protein [Roseivirga pacifica]|uniref:hypothetical protein n=1 Tax=Roseivirga pacifica TaxID=1267423 RepID=UPI00227D293D|nr:hypothetical protein [Roseivirga pacifica]
MASPKTISKNEEVPEALDFQFLKSKGLDFIQELAGENWTDFNAHDPGVTILEQLAYGLTELGYRSNLDFVDLLASQQKARKGKPKKDTFYTAAQILPSNPLTTKDYRKLIIDRVKGVRNIWILPLNSFTRRKNIKGLYLALLEPDYESGIDPETTQAQVKKQLNLHSNLGEAFEDVILLKKQEIYVQANIELESNVIAEAVHANIILELERLITRPLRFYSLKEMLDRGFNVNQIFDGPQLKNGFINNDFLREKDSIFYSNQLLNAIRNIEGVKAIEHFNILIEKQNEEGKNEYVDYFDELASQTVDEVVVVKWSHAAALGSKIYKNANDHNFFSYAKDGVHIHLYQKEVDRYLKALKAKVKLRFTQKHEHNYDFEVPKGEPFEIEQYHSIQHHFPKVYGLSKDGIPEKASATRKAQIYQLKAYLIFFEQIMTNYLAQLSRFNELFSLDKKLKKSYFTQVPTDIPQLYKVVGQLEKGPTEDFEQSFNKVVKQIMAELDSFYHRRKNFLAHLLARFGDDTMEFSPEKFNYYFDRDTHRQHTINNWINILENYPHLSGDKARSFDHTSPLWREDAELKNGSPNISVLEKRVRLTLGLPLEVKRIATNLNEQVRFDKKFPSSTSEIAKQYPEYELQPFSRLSVALFENEIDAEETVKKTSLKHIEIDEDLFRRGIWEDNLRIIRSPKTKNTYLLLFKVKEEQEHLHDKHKHKDALEKDLREYVNSMNVAEEQQKVEILLKSSGKPLYVFEFKIDENGRKAQKHNGIYRVLATYRSYDNAHQAAENLKQKLVKMNLGSEGFYVLDHILLRPRDKKVRVNILLNDPSADWSFRLTKAHKLTGIEKGIRKDIRLLRSLSPTYELSRRGQQIIVWKDGGRTIGRCSQKYNSQREAEIKAREIQAFFGRFSDFDIYDPEKIKFKREVENSNHPLHHYSFTITVFLSGWTARFKDPEFRNLVEILFRKNTPAHIGINFKWLGLNDMVLFESMYDDWLFENRKSQIDFDTLNQISDNLLHFAKRSPK